MQPQDPADNNVNPTPADSSVPVDPAAPAASPLPEDNSTPAAPAGDGTQGAMPVEHPATDSGVDATEEQDEGTADAAVDQPSSVVEPTNPEAQDTPEDTPPNATPGA